MNLKFLLISIFCVFLNFSAIKLANALEGAAIIGGDDAPKDKFPYHVVIELYEEVTCGGGIIDDYFVVTAAHCVADTDGFYELPVQVVGGINDLNSKTLTKVQVDVEKMYIPKDFLVRNKTMHVTSDIAVLKLKQSLNLEKNKHLKKLKLPRARSGSYTGDKAVITGFGWNWIDVKKNNKTGKTSEDGGSYGKLRYAETKIMSNAECQSRYTKKITKSHMCASVEQRVGNEGVCSGDSGGPLVYNGDTLIGVVSVSPVGCIESKRPAIYTRVSEFREFIHRARLDIASPTILTDNPPILRH